MSSILDLVGSLIFGVALSALVLRMTEDGTRYVQEANLAHSAQTSAETLAELMAADIRRVGLSTTGTAFSIADSNQVAFRADLDADGSPESIRYYSGTPGDATSTPNPNDLHIYRTIDGSTPDPIPLGVTAFRLRYYDNFGNALPFPVDKAVVRQVEVELAVESTFGYDAVFPGVTTRFRVRPKNLAF